MQIIKVLMVFVLWHTMSAAADPAMPLSKESLNSLSLSQAEQLWRQKNREIQLARDQVAGVAADRLTAAQRPNAQLSLNTSAINTGHNAPGWKRRTLNDSDMVLRIDQTFERGGKRDLRIRNADLKLEAAQHDLANAIRQGHLMLYQAYYDLMLAQEKQRIAEDNALLFRKTVAAAKLRLSAGDIAKSELARIDVDALRAQNDVRQARNDLEQAQAELAYQIGVETDAKLIQATDGWTTLKPEMGLSTQDIDARSDVRSALLQVSVAETARDLAESLKTRDVTLGLQVEHNGSNAPSHSVGFGISVPLMTGYEYQGEVGRAEAELLAARDDLERVRAQARTEITKARSDLESAAERVKRFDEYLLVEAGRALESSEFAYRHGALSVMDLLDARRTYKATQLDSVTARADYAKALAAWRYAFGGEDFK